MGEIHDAPNQQVVRADGSGPWEEGTGGAEPEPEPQAEQAEQTQPSVEQQQAEQQQPPEKPVARRRAKPDRQDDTQNP